MTADPKASSPRAGRRRPPRGAPKADSAPTGPAGPAGIPLIGSGRVHPPIGLGLWGLGRWSPPEAAKTQEVLAHGLERGVLWFDTAEVYGAGRSERLLGDALARRPPGQVLPFVSTKLSWEHLRAGQIRAALLGSRRRLGLPRIDLYLVHAPDPHVPMSETFGTLAALQDEGLFDNLGVSNFSLEQLIEAEAAAGPGRIRAVQVHYNILEEEEARPLLEHARTRGIGVEAYTPTARGLLAGRFLTGRGPPPGDPRHGHGLFAADRFPEARARAGRLLALAREAQVPLLSVALHAIARHGVAPVFGASRPEQVDELLAAWAIRPPEPLLDRAERIGQGHAD
ncbi:MAG: aldo/keto reductase [Thermoplasmata archaeon]